MCNVNLELPDNWFLYALEHSHTRIVFRGDKPMRWTAILQHIDSGRMTQEWGSTPQEALNKTIALTRGVIMKYIVTVNLDHGYIVLPPMELGFYGDGSPENYWTDYFMEMYPHAAGVDVEEVEDYS